MRRIDDNRIIAQMWFGGLVWGQPHGERTDSPARTLKHSFKVRHGEPWTTGKQGHPIDCPCTEQSVRVASFPRQNISKPVRTAVKATHMQVNHYAHTLRKESCMYVMSKPVMLQPDLLCAVN